MSLLRLQLPARALSHAASLRIAPYRTYATTMRSASPDAPLFDVSPVPPSALRGSEYIRTAAALIIGDEVLNGKTADTNSAYFAKFCFQHGIDLKRIEVIPDDEADIVEASRRLAKAHELVITSGGIGPTHDDITYESLAKAFEQPLEDHPETLRRMDIASTARRGPQNRTPEQQAAFARMALLPSKADVLFVRQDLGVPVVRLDGRLHVLPGIPTLFERLLDGLVPYLALPPADQRPLRVQIFTSLPESSIAPTLTALQKRVKEEDIRVGSYPRWGGGVFVSLIGRDHARVRAVAEEVAQDLEGEVQGPDTAADKPQSVEDKTS